MKNKKESYALLSVFFTLLFSIFVVLSMMKYLSGYNLQSIYLVMLSNIMIKVADMFSFNARVEKED